MAAPLRRLSCQTLGVMKSIGKLTLRDRVFEVKLAEVTRRRENWCIEIETQKEEFNDENWAPYLYHEGLRLPAQDALELQGQSTSWQTGAGPHPEKGTMYVFGHHDVRNCKVAFGSSDEGRIQLRWEGLCDVFWNEEFKDDVPFICECLAVAADV